MTSTMKDDSNLFCELSCKISDESRQLLNEIEDRFFRIRGVVKSLESMLDKIRDEARNAREAERRNAYAERHRAEAGEMVGVE